VLNRQSLSRKVTCSHLIWATLYNQNLLPIEKIHFTHLQQYDKNHCVYLARIGRHGEEKLSET